MKNNYLEGGCVCAPHGVRGVLKVMSYCDSPKVLAAQKRVFLADGDGYRECRVLTASVAGDTVLMHLEGIDDRNTADLMKNKVLFLAREDIPVKVGGCLVADLEGAPALDAETGETLGTVKEIVSSVASRLYVIQTDRGEVLVPDVPAFIKEVSPEGVKIAVIPGLFEP